MIRAPALVSVIGAGNIGVGWAIVFARAGHQVALHDVDPARLSTASRELRARLDDLASFELLDEPATAVGRRVRAEPILSRAVAGVGYVQECVSEDVELKRALFSELDRHAPADAVLASSSSMIPCSRFAAEVAGRERCLVAHPANPPYLLPIVELVPAPFTGEGTVLRASGLLAQAGMSVVRLGSEIDGFVFNRLQGALGDHRTLRDGRSQHAGRNRCPRAAHGSRVPEDGRRARTARSVDAGPGATRDQRATATPSPRPVGGSGGLARPGADAR